ncbi:MAG: hypothetical protein CR986_07920 [Ignavibacteriae bacterium]|nr:MAG: hypothetical protein CR986_07920 [Ignavibacteriota bacterium]
MNGKAILILTISFSTIFFIFGKNFFVISQNSTNEMVERINEKKALNIANSATNIVVSYFWQQPDSVKLIGTSKTFFDSVKFDEGFVTSRLAQDPIDSNLYHIKTNAFVGSGNNKKQKTVIVLYGPQKLTKMASYSENSGNIWWTGDDTVKGAIYCRSSIPVYNHPTFLNEVYSHSYNFKLYPDGDWATRMANHYPNVDPNNLHFKTELKRPNNALWDLKSEAKTSGWYLYGGNSLWDKPSKDTMFIELKGQMMDVKFSESATPVTYNIASKVPNGIIYADNYVVRLKGKLDGQLSISCDGEQSQGKGKIMLDDDITYQSDPSKGPSDDLLGLIAGNNVEVSDTPPNQTDINIQAAIYSQLSGLTAENAKTKPESGTINFYGSLIEGRRMEVGRFDPATGKLWGYGRKYAYDDRLKTISSPGFPQLAGFNVLAWYEGDPTK